MTDPTFKSNRLAELPTRFNDEEGRAWAQGMGAVQDDETDLLRVAALSRFPFYCPDDALDLCGAWLNLIRLDGEENGTTESGYRGRLCAAWPAWIKAGTPQSITDSLNAYGLGSVEVFLDYQGAFMPGAWYSRFWVVINRPMIFLPMILGQWVLGEGTLGSNATVEQVKAIKKQILFWKDVRGYPVAVVLNFRDIHPPVGIDATLGVSILGGGANFVRWEIGKIYGLDTFMPFTLGGFSL